MATHHAAVGYPGEGGALREIGSGRWRRILPHCLPPCSCARRGQVSLAALAAGGPASDHHIGSGARARERPPCSIRCASPPEVPVSGGQRRIVDDEAVFHVAALQDRKSTRLNSSH